MRSQLITESISNTKKLSKRFEECFEIMSELNESLNKLGLSEWYPFSFDASFQESVEDLQSRLESLDDE